ncbi:MAG: ADP-ribosylglycohydrolase family protein [Planctomycetaceae bacterium]
MDQTESIIGSLLGTSVGDALGLPYEGLTPQRAKRILGPPDRCRLVFGRGMFSDDTEHTCMVAQSLIKSGFREDEFQADFARRLKWWLAGCPAGVGFATLRSILKLWLGWPPGRSGVDSAGNGPAMRAPLFGAVLDDPPDILDFVRLSTVVTHQDPRAFHGAATVALAALAARTQYNSEPHQFPSWVRSLLGPEAEELHDLLDEVAESVAGCETTRDFAERKGMSRGISGYVLQTVPIAIHAWLSHRNSFRSTVMSVIECGGDADTTAAIVGGITGAAVGTAGIPPSWILQICDRPRSVEWIRTLGRQLAECVQDPKHHPQQPVTIPAVPLLCRNVLFAIIVIGHGFRRIFPR